MKKGQSGVPQWLVMLILGVTLSMVVGATYYSVFVETQKSKQSFEDLTEKINLLHEGDTLDYSLYLDSSDILISFTNGDDYVGEKIRIGLIEKNDCKRGGKIKVSPSCGSYPCLCICDTDLQYEFEESCTEHALVCYPFIDKELTFYDPTCSSVYKEGENNGILQLHLQLKGNVLSFCENKDCISEENQATVEDFSTYVAQYKSCLSSKSTCTCNLNYDFLEWGYALNFYSDKIELYDAFRSIPIASESFTTNIGSNIPEVQYTNFISLYLFQLQLYDPESTLSWTTFVASPSIESIAIIGDIEDMPKEVDTTLLFKDNKLYFTSEDISQYTSCSIDERVIL